jgi:uncharacterized protein YutE (UPF0331/DUF86 family)
MKEKRLRKDLISGKLRQIVDSVNLVSDNIPDDFEEFVSSGLVREGIYKKIEFAIECIIDICNIINSDLELGIPDSEEHIIKILEKNKIISKEVLALISDMKKFRNILIHKYGDIDDLKAFEEIKEGLKDFELIINEFEKFLKKHK